MDSLSCHSSFMFYCSLAVRQAQQMYCTSFLPETLSNYQHIASGWFHLHSSSVSNSVAYNMAIKTMHFIISPIHGRSIVFIRICLVISALKLQYHDFWWVPSFFRFVILCFFHVYFFMLLFTLYV